MLFSYLLSLNIDRWTYQTEKQLNGRGVWGQLTTYGGGGFVQQLGKTKAESEQIFADLKVRE